MSIVGKDEKIRKNIDDMLKSTTWEVNSIELQACSEGH